jgi:REP element-mobilizing transposase RayT
MEPQPLYDGRDIEPAYQLRYDWTAWASAGTAFPKATADIIATLRPLWERDGIRVLESACSDAQLQILCSVRPSVAPVVFVARLKGRRQHALRGQGLPAPFSRKLAMRSIGDNSTADGEQYILNQVRKEQLADPRFEESLRQFTIADAAVDLSIPTESRSGRYWYNLHLVLVVTERFRITDAQWLGKIRDQSVRIARRKGCAISRLAVMPDRVHIALRGKIDQSPRDIALAFQNNLAYALRQRRAWQDTYYVGTFSEYDMGAIRRSARRREREGEPV